MQAISGLIRLLSAVLFVAGLAGCRTLSKKEELAESAETSPSDASKPPSVTLPVGVVEHVDESARFVLIRSSRSLQIEPDQLLTVHGAQGEPVARVKVSPARKGPFLTADIVDGSPKKGQQATMDYTPPAPGNAPDPFVPGSADPNAIQVLE